MGTARRGSELRSLGTCHVLKMEVPGLGEIKVRPTVLPELSHEFNIGAGCLSSNRLSLDFGGSTPRLRGPRGTAQLINVIREPDSTEEPSEFPVTIANDQTLQPREVSKVEVIVPASAQKWGFQSTIPDPQVVPIPGEYDSEYVFIRNMRPKPVTVRRGKQIGKGVKKGQGPGQGPPTPEQLQELWTRLELDTNPVLKEHPAAATKLRQILYKRYNVFSREDSKFGRTPDHEMTIRLKPGTNPIRQKLRPLNPDMSKDLKTQLDSWLAAGVVQPSRSAWASPLVPVRKKNGTTRWAVDYRRLNSVTLPDAWPIPNVSELLMRLGGSKYFSTVDCVAAYHTIPLTEASRELTAFVTPYGLYEWLCMPFGLCNAGGEFTRFIEETLREIPEENKQVYLDDNLLHTPKLMQHLDIMDMNFAAYEKRGIKIGPEKTKLLQTKVQFLGHEITSAGIAMIPEYVDRILKWEVPKNPKELNSMIGFFAYYADHIIGFGTMTAEMNSLKKAEPGDFKWTPQMTENLEKLKKEFEKAPIRAFPQWNSEHPFLLQTDFSGLGLGAVLSQVQNGKERLIAAASRKASKYERNYSSFKGELAAVIFGVRKFHHMLCGRKFVAITDHAALKHLATLKEPRGITARWIECLSSYDFTVRHKAGVQNSNADGLSRAPQLDPPDPLMEHEEATYVGNIDETAAPTNDTLDRTSLITAQKRDPVLRMVRTWMTEGAPTKEAARGLELDAQRYLQVLDAIITTRDGLLGFKYNLNKPAEPGQFRALVPEGLKEQVFLHLHCHPTAGHFGAEATKKRARSRFYYPSMGEDLSKAVASCTTCVAKRTTTDNKKGVTHQPRRTGYPMQRIYLDLVGPLPLTTRSNRYILTIEDAFTRWVAAIPIPNKEASTVARHFVEKWVYIWGTPIGVHSDNGKEFTANLFMEVMKALKIQKTTTPPYNPHSNIVERFHRSLHSTMRVLGDQTGADWERLLPVATFAYNTKSHTATGLSPHYALLGREARLPVDLLVQLPDERDMEQHDFVADLKSRLRTLYGYMKGKENAQILRNGHGYDEGTVQNWQEGQKVWYFLPKKIPGRAPKHTSAWTGPWAVVRREAKVLIRIKPANEEGPERVVHASRLRPIHTPRASMGRLPAGTDLYSSDDEEPTRIPGPAITAPPSVGLPPTGPGPSPARLTLKIQNQPEEMIRDKETAPTQGDTTPTTTVQKDYPPDELMENLPTMPPRVWEPEGEEDEVMPEHMETDPSPIKAGCRPKSILHKARKKIEHTPYRAGTLQKYLSGVPSRYPTRGTRSSPMELETVPETPMLENRVPAGDLQIQDQRPQQQGPAAICGPRRPALPAPQPASAPLSLPAPDHVAANTPLSLETQSDHVTARPQPSLEAPPSQPSLEAPPSQLALQYQPTATQQGQAKRARPSSTSEHETTTRLPAQKQLRIKGGQRHRVLSPPASPTTSDQDMPSDTPKPTRKPRPRSVIENARHLLQESTSDSLDVLVPAQPRARKQPRTLTLRNGWDIRSQINCTLPPNRVQSVPASTLCTRPNHERLNLSTNDSLLQRGVYIVNQVSDQDPRTLRVLLHNINHEPVKIQQEERLAQVSLIPNSDVTGLYGVDDHSDGT